MKIIRGKIDWMEKWNNSPVVELLVDRVPSYESMHEMVYDQSGSIYYAEKDGHVSFFSYSKPDRGFGGRTFDVKLRDGTTKKLHGPWSSSASFVNKTGFGPCAEVRLTSDREAYKRGYTFFSGAVTVAALVAAAEAGLIDPKEFYRQNLDWNATKFDPIEIPEWARVTFVPVGHEHRPAVELDGELWTKDTSDRLFKPLEKIEKKEEKLDPDLSGEQSGIFAA